MSGKIAELRAWRERKKADSDGVRLYIASRWEMLNAVNRQWLLDKVMSDNPATPEHDQLEKQS